MRCVVVFVLFMLSTSLFLEKGGKNKKIKFELELECLLCA